MDLIFKIPYHIHLLMDFNFFLFNMHVKELCSWASIHIIFIISLTTFNPPLTQWYHSRLQFNTLNGLVTDYLSVIIGPPYLATTQKPSFSLPWHFFFNKVFGNVLTLSRWALCPSLTYDFVLWNTLTPLYSSIFNYVFLQ